MSHCRTALLSLGAVLIAITGCTADAPPRPPQTEKTINATPGVPGGVITTRTELSARVTFKDNAARRLTLLGPDGKQQIIDVPKAAVNFDQINAGDLVVITTTEQIVIAVCNAMTTVEQGELEVAAQAKKGEKPGAAIASVVQFRSRVADLDRVQRTVTILSDDGRVVVMPVRADVDISKHRIGEQVIMRITRLMEIGVEKTPAK